MNAEARRRLFEDSTPGTRESRVDPVAWQEELEARRLWDATLMDGLEDEWPLADPGGDLVRGPVAGPWT
jgi:hypothetical protein